MGDLRISISPDHDSLFVLILVIFMLSLAPWRSPLARALHRNRSDVSSRYPQLATVCPDSRPANRTVVFRDFLDGTNGLLFVTDMRSEKIKHLAQNPNAELCWYFIKTREQFRISGEISVINTQCTDAQDRKIHQDAWHNLSEKSKQQFIWPAPGAPRTSEGYDVVENLDDHLPTETFAVLVLTPNTVDHLELRGTPQNRYQYWRLPDNTWKMQEVNP